MSKKQIRKNNKHNKRSDKILSVVIIGIFLTGMFIIALWFIGKYWGDEESKPSGTAEEQVSENVSEENEADIQEGVTGEESKEEGLSFPYTLENTNLQAMSFSVATVPNPDADGSIVDDIASLEIANTSSQYLEYAEFTVLLYDDTTYKFKVQDLPVSGTVQAFDINNTLYNDTIPVKNISCTDIQWQTGDQVMSDIITTSVEGTVITLTNTSANDTDNLEITCRCNFDGVYWGGISYRYPIGNIPAGSSITVDATECYLGQAAVVQIAVNE